MNPKHTHKKKKAGGKGQKAGWSDDNFFFTGFNKLTRTWFRNNINNNNDGNNINNNIYLILSLLNKCVGNLFNTSLTISLFEETQPEPNECDLFYPETSIIFSCKDGFQWHKINNYVLNNTKQFV